MCLQLLVQDGQLENRHMWRHDISETECWPKCNNYNHVSLTGSSILTSALLRVHSSAMKVPSA